MECKKCGSKNVNVQAVTVTKKKGKGIFYWLFFGWALDIMLWVFLTLPRLIFAIFRPRKTKSVVKSVAVCQQCGNQWNI